MRHSSQSEALPHLCYAGSMPCMHVKGKEKSSTMAGGRAGDWDGGKIGSVLAATVVGSWTICTLGAAPGAAARFCSKVGMTVFCRTSCSRSFLASEVSMVWPLSVQLACIVFLHRIVHGTRTKQCCEAVIDVAMLSDESKACIADIRSEDWLFGCSPQGLACGRCAAKPSGRVIP